MSQSFHKLSPAVALERLSSLANDLIAPAHESVNSAEKQAQNADCELELLRVTLKTLENGLEPNSAISGLLKEAASSLEAERESVAPAIDGLVAQATERSQAARTFVINERAPIENAPSCISSAAEVCSSLHTLGAQAHNLHGQLESAVDQVDATIDRLRALARQ